MAACTPLTWRPTMDVTLNDSPVESQVSRNEPSCLEAPGSARAQTTHGRLRIFGVQMESVQRRKLRRFVTDGFTTLLSARWRWSILFFVLQFIFTWFFFAVLYFIFSSINGDIAEEEQSDKTYCVEHVYSFATALLFSVETQHTIGYGYRHVNSECPHVVAAVFLQFMVGVGLQCLAIGIVFAKFQRGKRRSETVVFSKKVCVGVVDGHWSLMVRVGDFRESNLIGVKAHGLLIKRPSDDGDAITETSFTFLSEGGSEKLTLFWPIVLHHKINLESPFWGSGKPLVFLDFTELVVILEGTVESTSRPVQVRVVYHINDVAFGCRFKEIIPQLQNGKYHFKCQDIDKTEPAFSNSVAGRYEQNNNESIDDLIVELENNNTDDVEQVSNLQTVSYLSFALGQDLLK